MAVPIAFKPITADFEADAQRRLEDAPRQHAEALLQAYDVLEAAHKEGLLDLLHGAIGARYTLITTLSKYASQPEGVAGIRNLLTAAKMLTELDPEVLERLSKVVGNATKEHQQEKEPPSLWQLFKRANSEDSRRGLSFMTLVLAGLGRSMKHESGTMIRRAKR
jgi:uncharacterized protein YjgD (DUF1641 family)